MKMSKNTEIVSHQYITEKMKLLLEDLGEALLKYCRNGVGTIYIDDVKIDLFPSKGEWHKMSLYFKVME